MCYCLRALRRLDCPNGVEPLEGFESCQYGRINLGGATADCRALQNNFPEAVIVDCVQSGRSGGGGSGGGGGGSGGGGGGGGGERGRVWGARRLLVIVLSEV